MIDLEKEEGNLEKVVAEETGKELAETDSFFSLDDLTKSLYGGSLFVETFIVVVETKLINKLTYLLTDEYENNKRSLYRRRV